MSSGSGLGDKRISRCHNFVAYTTSSYENGTRVFYLCVDLTITTLTIKRANILSDILEQAGVVPVEPIEGDLRVNIQWERVNGQSMSTKVALVISALDMVMIYDIRRDSSIGPMIIPQSHVEGIHRMQWLPPPITQSPVSDVVGEGAHENSKQLLIFTKHALSVKLYSIDGEHVLLHIIKPQCGRAFFKGPDYRVWLIISRSMEYDSHPVIHHFLNTGSVSVLILQQRLQFLLILNLPQVSWSPHGIWFSVFSDSDSTAGYNFQLEGAVNFAAKDKALTPLLYLKVHNSELKQISLSSKYVTTWVIPPHNLPGYESSSQAKDLSPTNESDGMLERTVDLPNSLELASSEAELFIIASVCDRKRVLHISRISTHTPRLPRMVSIDIKSMSDCPSFRQRSTQHDIVYSTNSFISRVDFGSPICSQAAGAFLCIRLETGIFILRKSGDSGYRSSSIVVPTLKIHSMQLVSVKSRMQILVACVDHVLLYNLNSMRMQILLANHAILHAEMGRNRYAGTLVVYTSGGIEFCPLTSDENEAEESFVISRFKRKLDHHSFNSDITDTFGHKKN